MDAARRRVLALTGALLAGLADYTDSDGDATPTPGANGDTPTANGSGTPTERPDPGDEPAAFPHLDLATDPGIDDRLLAEQIAGSRARGRRARRRVIEADRGSLPALSPTDADL